MRCVTVCLCGITGGLRHDPLLAARKRTDMLKANKMLIQASDVTIGQKVGAGGEGVVYKAVYCGETVCAKVCVLVRASCC